MATYPEVPLTAAYRHHRAQISLSSQFDYSVQSRDRDQTGSLQNNLQGE
jgi:hypothetical protein